MRGKHGDGQVLPNGSEMIRFVPSNYPKTKARGLFLARQNYLKCKKVYTHFISKRKRG